MKHTKLVEGKIKEVEEYGDLHRKNCDCVTEVCDACNCDMYGLKDFLRTFASAIRKNDKEEFRGMIPKKRWVEDDNKYPDITWIKENYGKKQFNKAISELTTKLEKWK